MKEAKYIRSRNKITHLEENKTQKFDSVALAKQESRKLQMSSDGGFGRGSLRVEK